MRNDFRVAIWNSGRWQYEVARDAGLSEVRLCKFLRGRVSLRPEEEHRLRAVLGLEEAEMQGV